MNSEGDNKQLLVEEYRALREELLKCNANAQGILNWSYPVITTLFLAGLYSLSNMSQPLIVMGYYALLVPTIIVGLATVWFGEIVRQQRVEGYLFVLEDRINGEHSSGGYYENRLGWHHWLRKTPESPLEGFHFGHYRNMAIVYLLLAVFSELISGIIALLIPLPAKLTYPLLIVPILLIILIFVWFNNQATKYFGFGVWSKSLK